MRWLAFTGMKKLSRGEFSVDECLGEDLFAVQMCVLKAARLGYVPIVWSEF